MGKIVAFQSPLHGQCGTTASMVAMAYALQKEGRSIVLVHSQASYADLENLFYAKETKKDTFYDGIGLDGLCYTIKAQDLTRKDLIRATIKLDDYLYLLPSAAKRIDTERENILHYIITEKLPLFYDYVFVDTGSDHSAVSESIRKAADMNIVVIAQSRATLKEFSKDAILLCGSYDKNRKMNLKFLKQRYKNPIYAIPYCSEYGDAIASSSVRRFFHSYESLLKSTPSKGWFKKTPEDGTAYFFDEIKKLREICPDRDVLQSNDEETASPVLENEFPTPFTTTVPPELTKET